MLKNWIRKLSSLLFVPALLCLSEAAAAQEPAPAPFRKTSVSIVGDEFWINGRPTYEGRNWNGHKIQGLLLNSRMVQGIFDDRNPETAKRWAYPDTGKWDADRNTREFVDAMPQWKKHGLLAFTINLQGGSPEGYSGAQPWFNSAIEPDGSLNTNYMQRLERILDKADELGFAVILGCFYFGQDQRLKDEVAIIRALDNTVNWVFDHGYRNVLLEVDNECNAKPYDHPILKPDRVHELINHVRDITRASRRLYVGTSYGGGRIPEPNVVRVSDFLLMHGNGIKNPARISEMVQQARKTPGYMLPKPILFNEDDHFDFDKPTNNFVAAIREYASWGYFDPGTNNYRDGYQCPPVNWGINTERKRAFFQLLSEMTESTAVASAPPVAASLPPDQPLPREPGLHLVPKYHGWSNAYVLNNKQVQAVVVPAIGRIMQFGFIGEEGVFWENRGLDGTQADWTNGWSNFGGDKTWPSPQSDWPNFTKREGMFPPPAFDGIPSTATIESNGPPTLVLISQVDPCYGVRVTRKIRLEQNEPKMVVQTIYQRAAGEPAQMGVWVITQLKEPLGVFLPISVPVSSPAKYTLPGSTPPPSLKFDRGLLSLSRNPQSWHKIGTDSGSLLWVGEKCALQIDSPRLPQVLYPDQNSSAEVYTSADPLKYVELETLGPLHMVRGGDAIQRINTYTLFRRTEKSPEAEARKLLGIPDSPPQPKRR